MTVSGRAVRPTAPPGSGREEFVTLAGLFGIFLITASWWALALWPVQDAPYWLERTRYVCFGVDNTGLPDVAGWVGLTAGPVGMLTILLTGWPRGFRELLHNARRSSARAAALTVLTIGTALLFGGAALRVRAAQALAPRTDSPAEPPGTYPRLDRPAPELDLMDHNGARRTLASLRGRPALVTFAFAHCTTICPLIVQDALAAQRTLQGTDAHPAVLIVTLDPWRDTPARLASMAAAWKLPETEAWVLGGDVAAVERTLTAWQVPRTRDEVTGDVIHPSLFYVIDAEGRVAFAATGGAGVITALLRRL